MVKKLQLKFFSGLLPAIMLLLTMASWGQSIWTNPITGTNPNTASPYTTGDVKDTNITVSGISRGTGITGTSANDRYTATGWDSAAYDSNDYFSFTLTPVSGYRVNLSGFVYVGQKSGTGPQQFSIRTSLDNFATDVYTYTNTGTTAATFSSQSAGLTGTAFQNLDSAITLRFYSWGATGAGGTFSINSFTFNGTIQSVIVPDVTTTAAGSITVTTATAGGDVTADNGSAVTHKGVVWATTTAPTIALTTKTDDGTGTGTFTSSITGLTTNTKYYYRAYATNTLSATTYGTEYSFYSAAFIPAAPTLSNAQLTSIDAVINANGNAAAILYTIRVNGTSYVQADGTPGTSAVWQTAGTWGTKTIMGLTPGTSYTVDVAAQNTGLNSTTYSTSATLATLAASSPHLTPGTSSLAFGTMCINTTGAGSFTFSGENLINPATIAIAALSGYSYSLTSGGTYTSTLSIPDYTGAATTVYVHFTPTAVQSYNGTITVSGTGSNSGAQFATGATGSGINTPSTVASVNGATSITQFSATISGTTVAGCSAITVYVFEYSTVSIAPGSGTTVAATTTGTTFTFNLTGLQPGTTYYYRAKVTDGTGTIYGNQYSFATSALPAPVAAAASAINQTGFTANWSAVSGASQYLLDVSASAAFGAYNPSVTATDLFISEYTEGSSNNKYIEVYNGTGAAVSLADYRLRLYVNGLSTINNDVVLSGTLANGASIVYKNSSAALYTGTATNNSAVSFNGNDAVVLYKISTASNVDIFGRIGEDPGTAWTAAGGYSTVDKTLRRKNTITGGVTVNPASGFPTLTTEWDVYEIDNVANLGGHDFGFVPSYITGYNGATVAGTSATITGLTPNTNYYYRVRANSATSTSANSNTITATTAPDTVAWVIPNGGTTPQWIPAVAPDSTISVIIAAGYDTATYGSFTANNLTVNAGYTLTVNPHGTITVYGFVTNNAGVDSFVVQDNGALVQRGTGTNATPITVVKNSNPLYRLDYTLWSAPTTGQTLRQFSMGTSNNRFYEYVSSATQDEGYYPVDPLQILFDGTNKGKGFLIRMPNSVTANGTAFQGDYAAGNAAYTFAGTFKGTPNTGDITYPLYNAGGRCTAIGNPYPSPINVAAFYAANTTVIDPGSALYFWRKKNSATTDTGSYATLTLADYNANDSGDNDDNTTGGQNNEEFYLPANAANWAIAPGQGFIVQTDDAAPANPQVTFSNAMRQAAAVSGGEAFFKSGISQVSRYRMRVTSAADGASQMSVVYMPQGTLGLDYGYDGKKLGEPGLSLYTVAQSTALSIQARPDFEAGDVVPVGFTATSAGSYTIALSHTDGVFANGQNIYLKDKAEGIIRDMGQGDYTFTTGAGTFDGRFEALYTTAALGTDSPVTDANTVIVYQNGGAININSGLAVLNSITIFDIRGRKLYSADKVNATYAAITNLTATQQLLIVEITTDKGTVAKKIVF